MANQNGLNAPNAAMYSNINGGIMPSAGHYSDMQVLMQHFEQMSGWMQQTREESARMQELVGRLQIQVERVQAENAKLKAAASNEQQQVLTNGDHASSNSAPAEQQPPQSQQQDEPSNLSLRNTLSAAERRIQSLESTVAQHQNVQSMYEDTLTSITEHIRNYVFEQQNHTIALHQHYTQLLQQSRSETVEAQLMHQDWQKGLGRLSEMTREALKSSSAEVMPYRKRVAELKEENRVLRGRLGWDPLEDSSSDEDESDAGQRRISAQSGTMEGQ